MPIYPFDPSGSRPDKVSAMDSSGDRNRDNKRKAALVPHHPFANTSVTWTTADELAFIHSMYTQKKLRVLRFYVQLAHNRKWFGTGMRVEAGRVILEARDLLAKLEKEMEDN